MYVPRILLAVALLVLAIPVAVVGSTAPVPVGHDRADAATADPENSSLTASNVTILGTSLEPESLDSYAAIRIARGNGTLAPDTSVSVDDTVVIRFEAPGLRSTLADYDGSNLTARFHRFVTETNATFHASHANPAQRFYRGENVPLSSDHTYDRIVVTDPAATVLIPGPENETYYQVVDLDTVEIDEGDDTRNRHGIDCADQWGVTLAFERSSEDTTAGFFRTDCYRVGAVSATVTRTTVQLAVTMGGVDPGERFRVRPTGTGTNQTDPTIWPATVVPWHEAVRDIGADDGTYHLPVDISDIESNTTVVAKISVVQPDGTRERVHEETFLVPTETTTAPSTTTTAPTTTETVPISTTPDAEKTTATPPATSAAPTNNTPTSALTPQTDEVPGFTLLGAFVALTCLALLGRRR
ncbi:hypothetical protein [Haloarchaeobius sp. TZWSO28]|uniref:hypothetical protein n=1 Tax=Haloarchaeobius sp. TZWSO28 TaxID=3446119 RepID=UPI003EC0D83B